MVTTTGTRLPRSNDKTISSGTTMPTLLPPVGSRTVRKVVMVGFVLSGEITEAFGWGAAGDARLAPGRAGGPFVKAAVHATPWVRWLSTGWGTTVYRCAAAAASQTHPASTASHKSPTPAGDC